MIYTVAPSSIIIASNVSIILKLQQMTKQRRFMTNMGSDGNDKENGERRIAVMLICVSTFFVLTTMPWGIFFIGKYT